MEEPGGEPGDTGIHGRSLQIQSASKGVFITTSTFTKDAKQAAAKARGSVVLVDGEQLSALMMDHGVCGVSHKWRCAYRRSTTTTSGTGSRRDFLRESRIIRSSRSPHVLRSATLEVRCCS